MAQILNPQFELVLRMNRNTSSRYYGKFYPERNTRKTISLRGLINHMAGHHSIYPRDLIEGIVTSAVECLSELLSQGNPVKLDGLGTFDPQVESVKHGISKEDILDGKWNAQEYVAGVHIRFLPEGEEGDKLTSRFFKSKCDLTTVGVIEPVLLTPEGVTPKKWGKKIVPLDTWITEQQNAIAAAEQGDGD